MGAQARHSRRAAGQAGGARARARVPPGVPAIRQHADQHDHQRRTQGIFIEAHRIHAFFQVLHIASVANRRQVEVRHSRDKQEHRNRWPKGKK